MSSLLLNFCIDPLLWLFSKLIVSPGLGKVLACADDLAPSAQTLSSLVLIFQIYSLFAEVSGLHLQPSKCVFVLLSILASLGNIALVRAWLAANIPVWKDADIANHGKYFGIFLRPRAQTHQWVPL